MKTPQDFLKVIDNEKMSALHRAHAILWWVGREDVTAGLSAQQVCQIIEMNGHAKQNISRLKKQLSADRIVNKVPSKDEWRLRMTARKSLDSIYEPLINIPKPPPKSDSILPRLLFEGARGYIEKVVFQINASYDQTLYDCCAVMCRRLLETLMIEVYEYAGRSDEIKNSNGHFYMFSDLLKIFENDKFFNLSRNVKQGLSDFKKLGDLSAHNRKFNARKEDVDRIRDGMRVASEELMHLSHLI